MLIAGVSSHDLRAAAFDGGPSKHCTRTGEAGEDTHNWVILLKTEDCGPEASGTQATALKQLSQGHRSRKRL